MTAASIGPLPTLVPPEGLGAALVCGAAPSGLEVP